jgi:hypothetical protein
MGVTGGSLLKRDFNFSPAASCGGFFNSRSPPVRRTKSYFLRRIVGFVCREMETAGGVGGTSRKQLRQVGDIRRDPPRLGSSHVPRPRFLRRLSPFPFAGLLIVSSDTALDHFVAVFVASHDECDEIAAAKAKCAERDYNENLQQQLAHGLASMYRPQCSCAPTR